MFLVVSLPFFIVGVIPAVIYGMIFGGYSGPAEGSLGSFYIAAVGFGVVIAIILAGIFLYNYR